MTTIANKLTRIASAKEAIKAAIEAKGVEVANAPLEEYPAKIAEIKAGSGAVADAPIKEVNFYDYDGTNLYSYTWAEAQALTELPPLPSHEGLVSQGWNYSLTEIIEQFGKCDVGAIYTTDDNSTKLYMTMREGRLSLTLKLIIKTAGAVIHWGDGNITNITTSATTSKSFTHAYSSAGEYVIRIVNATADASQLVLGTNSTSNLFGDSSSSVMTIYSASLNKVEMGCATVSKYAFAFCKNLKVVIFSKESANAVDNLFNACHSLRTLILPQGSGLNTSYCDYCYSLKRVSLPKYISAGNRAFRYCYTLQRLVIPAINSYNANIGSNVCQACTALTDVGLPSNLYTLSSDAFNGCGALTKLKCPKELYNINNNAMYQCWSLAVLDCTECQHIPTLAYTASSTLQDDVVVKVPAGELSEWKSASNWSSFANIIGV